ncbi:MAG: deoxyribodipyrimidine photo-lyase, partial [Bacteroidota bacterium]
MKCNVVWLKRDLRLRDHPPFQAAIEAGLPILPLYCFEPSLLNAKMYAPRHWRFVYESIQSLNLQLQVYGARVNVFHAELGEVLNTLWGTYQICTIYAHQETGVKLTFDRDRWVQKFCEQHEIELVEFQQDGVGRALKHRGGWEERWKTHMNAPQVEGEYTTGKWIVWEGTTLDACGFPESITQPDKNFQPGGETYAWRYLKSFTTERAKNYTPHISKPEFSRKSGSRLSPYLAYGNLSARQIHQYVSWYQQQVPHGEMLGHFHERLWWRSHYMQKLETEYRIEWENLNTGFDCLRWELNEDIFEAWSSGYTGYPMVDASMRCLIATGFMNFRMRAMLATFWCFTLQQPWQPAADYTARLFLDFEPGIHYAQWQMQAGMSGYHTLRIYNPTTQSQRHDPSGEFVRKWVPELREVPAPQIYEPWKMTQMEQVFYHCRIGEAYPAPIVNLEQAHQHAKDAYWRVRQSPAVQHQLIEIWRKHCLPGNVEKYKEAAA